MASKSKRAGTATPQPRVAASTPVVGGDGNPSSSPLSPTRHSRLQEKAELQSLNDRLACYIDRVRSLETDNSRLTVELQKSRESSNREASNIKVMYESELGDARRLLDETAREKAKLEIDVKRLWEENEELKTKLEKKTKECSNAEGNARLLETRANDFYAKYNAAKNDCKKATDDLDDVLKEVEHLRNQLVEARKNLEDETLARVDLENCIQSLREELTFKDQIHMQELNDTRSLRQTEISEIDGRLTEQYEAKLQQSLQGLRDQYEAQMRANREEIEKLYENKIRNLEAVHNRNSNAAANALEELRSTRTRIDALNSRIENLESEKGVLISRIRDLEKALDNERARRITDVSNLEAELERLRKEMALHMQEYQDLMDIKVSLDLEIAAYDKLLCGEETRLNISSKSDSIGSHIKNVSSTRATPSRKTPSRNPSTSTALKRKRTFGEQSEQSDFISESEYFSSDNATGDIEISEIDPAGKFIKLHNKGNKEVQIGGWQLSQISGDNEIIFKFHRTVKVDAGTTINVWSTGAGVAHEPPINIVMKGQKWLTSESKKITLLNGDGDQVAFSERIKKTVEIPQVRYRKVARQLSVSAADRSNNEEIYHQQGEPKRREEQCQIM